MLSESLVPIITTLQCNIKHLLVNRVSEPLVGSKMINTLEFCLSKFSNRIERQKEGYQGTNITLIFTRPVDLFLIPYF